MKRKLNFLRVCMAMMTFVSLAMIAHAQTFSVSFQFPQDGTEGSNPYIMNMIQATDGNLYGTTESGGAGNKNCNNYVNCGGTIFTITPAGGFTSLYTFCISNGCPDGRTPQGGIMQASDGNFYGMTYAGGTYNDGTIFRFTPKGKLTTLHSFCNSPNTCSPNDGSAPTGQLIQASNGDLYGVTTGNSLFKITLKGEFTLLYTFPPGTSPVGTLLQLASGTIYGVSSGGGAHYYGSVFETTLDGKVTTLYSFCAQQGCPDGIYPQEGVTLGNDGNLYGATSGGGPDDFGTVFKLTTKGKFTLLHQFTGQLNGGQDGQNPTAPLTLASDGNLYSTTPYGGNDAGIVFQVAKGKFSNVYLFPSQLCTLAHPFGGLIQSTNGTFYGSDNGTCLIDFSIGLGPFVSTIPTFGKDATKVIIQGTDLTGATKVTFNGKAAKFKVVSASEITTTVPKGASSGKVKVTTPGGVLVSNVAFVVNK